MLAPSCHRASVRAVPLTVQAFSSLLYFFLNSCSSFYSQIVRETPSLLPEPLHFLLKSELPACDVLRTMSLLWQHSFSDHSMDVFLTFYIIKYPVCLCISLSLSLSHTHTHTCTRLHNECLFSLLQLQVSQGQELWLSVSIVVLPLPTTQCIFVTAGYSDV